MPGRSTAGATFDSTAGASGSFDAKSSGWRASSGDRNASEIFGVCPSSRRRLAQNAASMIDAIASGGGASDDDGAVRGARRADVPGEMPLHRVGNKPGGGIGGLDHLSI